MRKPLLAKKKEEKEKKTELIECFCFTLFSF